MNKEEKIKQINEDYVLENLKKIDKEERISHKISPLDEYAINFAKKRNANKKNFRLVRMPLTKIEKFGFKEAIKHADMNAISKDLSLEIPLDDNEAINAKSRFANLTNFLSLLITHK